MPNFDVQSLLGWFHFVGLALAGGSMPVCLMLSGFEDANEDVRGLSAVIWKKVTVWGMRCAVFCGAALVIVSLVKGGHPFSQPHLMFKIGIAAVLVFLCETAPKQLGVGKRGAALLAMVLFLVVSFVALNHKAFSYQPMPIAPPAPAQMEPGEEALIIQAEPPVNQTEQPKE
jgi:hypothetical protein